MARKWWQRKWYFFLPVAVVLGAGVYFAAVGKWKIAALYFALAAFYAVLERWKWQRYGRPRERDSYGAAQGRSRNACGRAAAG